ncbi:MAG: SusC/RagA family TonB-linked outer membrane protein, partial [Gemmatimonadetes bacterium]|nr:SusC/RagA family TonB-linked outer membrane protein [Gemmatimonadota bacterium]
VGALNTVDQEAVTYRSVGNVTGEYQLPGLNGLSVTGRFGYITTNVENKFFAPSFNKGQAENGLNGTVSRGNPSEFSWLGDAFLTYIGNWDGGIHNLNATGGYSYQSWRIDSPSFFAQQLSSDLLGIDGIPSAELERTFLDVQEHRLASWFGRANYTFKDRYIATATFRADGSSRFGDGNRWGYFPSFAGAWRISEESFMDGAGSLSDLRLRVSWGKNGNEPFGNYLQYKDYVFGDPLAQARFGDEFVSTIRPSAADPNIKWEETSSWNFGLDYGFNNQRYWGSVEFYTKDTNDLLFSVPVAAGTNLSNFVTTNIGSLKNTGVEVTLNAMFIEGQGDGFTWDANFNAAYNSNEITEINPFSGGVTEIRTGGISGGVGSFIQILRPGEAVNSFYVYEHIRDGSGNPIYEDTNNDGTINEQDLYRDQNGDGIINQDDLRVNNKPAPDWILGHTSLMRYKKFDLGLTLLAQIGSYVYNNTSSTRGFYDQLRDQQAPNNLHESVLTTSFGVPQYFSDYYVESASFLRLNNLELGYTFSRALNGIRIYAVTQNLFTITGYSGIDPTAGINGIDNNIYPRSRTFTAGVNVRF